jgi:hypothetical protein
MHQLLKKLLVLNGYLDEAGGAGDAGNGGQAGAGGSGELGDPAAGGGDPGSGTGGDGSGAGDPPAGGGGGDPAAPPVADPGSADPVAKRYSDLTKQLRESQDQQKKSQQQLDAALAALERVTGSVKPPATEPVAKPVVTEDPEPTPPEFVDPDQYQRDMAAYTRAVAERAAKQALRAADADRDRERIVREQTAAKNAHAAAWDKRRTAAMEKYPDYVQVAEADTVPISPAMALTLTSLEHGGDVAYYLGQHLDEAQRIATLPPVMQAVELGKLEVKVMTPKPPAVSKAADPIKPLTGAGGAQTRSDDELSMDEYAAKRNGKR